MRLPFPHCGVLSHDVQGHCEGFGSLYHHVRLRDVCGLLQSIGIIGMMTVDFPIHISGFLSFFQILLLDLDSFGFAAWS